MFVTHPKFENPFLSGISSSGDRYYRAFELSGRLNWFIVTSLIRDDDLEMLHSVCCSMDEDLQALLQPMPHARAVSLQRIVASSEGDGRWEAHDISRVWRTAAPRGKWVLIFQERDGSESWGPFGEAVSQKLGERTLLYEAASPDLLQRTEEAMSELQLAPRKRSKR